MTTYLVRGGRFTFCLNSRLKERAMVEAFRKNYPEYVREPLEVRII